MPELVFRDSCENKQHRVKLTKYLACQIVIGQLNARKDGKPRHFSVRPIGEKRMYLLCIGKPATLVLVPDIHQKEKFCKLSGNPGEKIARMAALED